MARINVLHNHHQTRKNKKKSYPPAVETPSFSIIFTPSFPPQPLTFSTGSVLNTAFTLSKGRTVCALGLCMLLHSLARSLLWANPTYVRGTRLTTDIGSGWVELGCGGECLPRGVMCGELVEGKGYSGWQEKGSDGAPQGKV